MSKKTIALLPGDGIGPEIVAAAKLLLQALGDYNFQEYPLGGASLDAHGVALTPEVLDACRQADAVLMGAVGDYKQRSPELDRPEVGIDQIRQGLKIYANLRPIKLYSALLNSSPLKREIIEGTDILLVRELSSGSYFGKKVEGTEVASDNCEYTRQQVENIAHLAFQLAETRGQKFKVTSIDKANVLASSRLWRHVVNEVSGSHSGIELEHMLVDNAAMQLISRPRDFDVLLTENLFGDILSDEMATIVSSLGMIPSAGLSLHGPGLYESAHGSAPDIAGAGIANPIATFLAVALLFRYQFQDEDKASSIERAVEKTITRHRTADLVRLADTEDSEPKEALIVVNTQEMTDAVTSNL